MPTLLQKESLDGKIKGMDGKVKGGEGCDSIRTSEAIRGMLVETLRLLTLTVFV